MDERKVWNFFIKRHKACSLNHAYVTRDHRKSRETRNWLFSVKTAILQNRTAIEEVKSTFKEDKHFLICTYIWFIPQKKYFLQRDSHRKDGSVGKKGSMNQRVGDCSNFEKIPDDLIFNQILGIDDGFIAKQTMYKLPWKGTEHHIKLTVEIREHEDLFLKAHHELPQNILINA